MCLGGVAEKWAAFGWEVRETGGHDVEGLLDALTEPPADPAVPVVVIAYTTKGKGVSFMEGDAGWHGKAPSAEQTATALTELGAALEAAVSAHDSTTEGGAR
jgi:transketolase